MEATARSLASIYSFNSLVVSLILERIEEPALHQRYDDQFNSIGFVVAHLVDTRNVVTTLLGHDHASEGTQAPDASLQELKASWTRSAAQLKALFDGVSAEQLAQESAKKVPIGDSSVSGAVSFFAWHESYHVGQIGTALKIEASVTIQQLVHEHFSSQKG